ncbi:MAG: PKD domain-containing protein [Bacteroidales bacterium]|nr:PKD domain-containing protein [Bacteroidales bacterium]
MSIICLILFVVTYTEIITSQEYIKTERMSFNTSDYDEFGPFFFKNGILYVSNKKTDIITSKKSEEDEKYFFDIYFFPFTKDTSVEKILTNILNRINTPYNDGPVAVHNNTFYVSQNYDVRSGKNYKAPVGLFAYEFNKDSLLRIYSFYFNRNDYRVGHAFITNDGERLFFSSNMPGGFGGFDIYVVEKNDTSFGLPKNLGKPINSEFDEITPYFLNNRLYFASNRNNLQFDIYYSENINNKWEEVICLPEPINTAKYNEFSFICDSTYEYGFFSSNRKGSDDIFKFYSTLPSFQECDSLIPPELCYHFIDETSQYLDTLPVKYMWSMGDGTTLYGWEVDHCYKDFGVYNVTLTMLDTIGHENQVVATYVMELTKPIQPYITYSEPLLIGKEIKFDASESYFPDCDIKDYVWSFSDNQKFVGKKCTRVFNKAGTYVVKLGVVAKCNNQEIKKCSFVVIEVKEN